MTDIESLKEQKLEVQSRTTETMSSLLRDLTDMGVAVNPDVSNDIGQVKVFDKTSVFSVFDSHWKDSGFFIHSIY
jgi:hypothetical protein